VRRSPARKPAGAAPTARRSSSRSAAPEAGAA
jgi:hypothetical protein